MAGQGPQGRAQGVDMGVVNKPEKWLAVSRAEGIALFALFLAACLMGGYAIYQDITAVLWQYGPLPDGRPVIGLWYTEGEPRSEVCISLQGVVYQHSYTKLVNELHSPLQWTELPP